MRSRPSRSNQAGDGVAAAKPEFFLPGRHMRIHGAEGATFFAVVGVSAFGGYTR